MAETTNIQSDQPDAQGGAESAPAGKPRQQAPRLTDNPVPEPPKKPIYRRPIPLAISAVLLLVILIGGVWWWISSSAWEETDDAFIDGNIVPISPRIAGTVLRLGPGVDDNREVTKGQILVELDPKDVLTHFHQAEAALAAAQAQSAVAATNVELVKANTAAILEQAKAGVDQAIAGVTLANSHLASAQSDVIAAAAEARRRDADVKRFQALNGKSVSQSQLDEAVAANETAQADLEAAKKRVDAAQAEITQAHSKVSAANAELSAAQTGPKQVATALAQQQDAAAQVDKAQAMLEQYQLQKGYTTIYAPVNGHIARRTVQVGQYLELGQNMLAIVRPDVWVVANFKETQLAKMKPGQDVDFTVDAYPGKHFRGTVDSIQSGTGSRFSMLPPENATGNYVKVVQRVPVKILVDDADPNFQLSPGMSVVPSVHVSEQDVKPPKTDDADSAADAAAEPTSGPSR